MRLYIYIYETLFANLYMGYSLVFCYCILASSVGGGAVLSINININIPPPPTPSTPGREAQEYYPSLHHQIQPQDVPS